MASAKQPQPAAIRMTSNMSLLPKVGRSAHAERIERQQHRQRERQVQPDDKADLGQDDAQCGRPLPRHRQRRIGLRDCIVSVHGAA
jgi:hypothetical protein